VTSGQISLLETPSDRILTAKEAGLAEHIPEDVPKGPFKLLQALAKRGLQRDDVLAIVGLVAWDDLAP
jgi:hypothetical protein